MSITRRDPTFGPPEPRPSSTNTRNGSRALTPTPNVVKPSNEPANTTWRTVRNPPTSTTFAGSGLNVALPARSFVGANSVTSRNAPPASATASPLPWSSTDGTYSTWYPTAGPARSITTRSKQSWRPARTSTIGVGLVGPVPSAFGSDPHVIPQYGAAAAGAPPVAAPTSPMASNPHIDARTKRFIAPPHRPVWAL